MRYFKIFIVVYLITTIYSCDLNIFGFKEEGPRWDLVISVGDTILTDVKFYNGKNGWITGAKTIRGSSDVLLVTKNGGKSWEKLAFDRTPYFVHLRDTNKVTVFAYGKIVYTEDCGQTWINANFNFGLQETDNICFINKDKGWMCAYSVYRTSDGGKNWELISGIQHWTYGDGIAVSFIDENSGWLLTDSSDLFYTEDGGLSWEWIGKSNISFWGDGDMKFFNKNIGYIRSFMGVYKTFNGGKNWNLLQDTHEKELMGFYFINSEIGWAYGQKGIFYTKNGGDKWTKQTVETESSIRSLFMLDRDTGWACGNDGVILKYNP